MMPANLPALHRAQQTQARVRRLRVFRAIKHTMEREGRCLTTVEVAEQLGMSVQTVGVHMVALRGADGLPMPIPSGNYRSANSRIGTVPRTAGPMAHAMHAASRGFPVDPGLPIEVDLLMGERR